MTDLAPTEAGRILADPPLLKLRETALFADLDGTLAPIEATPGAVGPDPNRRRLLDSLRSALSGRLAVVSGRGLADLDRVLEGRVPAVAGVHGLVRRTAEGRVIAPATDGRVAKAIAAFRAFADHEPGVLVEDKGAAVALHYRCVPGAGQSCRALARDLAAALSLDLQEGSMVVELKPRGSDKGQAVEAFMGEPPFAGATPVFLGDDLTDEDGFRTVHRLGGFGIVVGARRPTLARFALADVAAARRWLERSLETRA